MSFSVTIPPVLPTPRALMEVPAVCKETDSLTCGLVYSWTNNETLARSSAWLIGKPLAILALLIAGLLIRWIIHRVIDKLVKRVEHGVVPARLGAQQRSADVHNESTSRRVQRAQGLGSLMKSIATFVIFGIVVVMMLSQIGVNVAPILASAGVLGLAIGFGAQSLVKDFLSGIFMMFEDQYGIGDAVDLGEAIGTVEAVGLRVTRVRDVDGTVWYVRNGEILRVGNQSQNWARSVLDISVGYGENLSRVRTVLKEVAHELWEDDAYEGVIIEEPEVWGVQSLSAEAVVVRVALKTKPLEQWAVGREMRERVKARFDHEGITMPHAYHRLLPDGSPLIRPIPSDPEE